MDSSRTYVAIDLKSFFASVECVERHLDPMTTNLVVADENRTEKTICLAISPALKSYGLPGRARLFEVVQKVQAINTQRKYNAPNQTFVGESCFAPELQQHPEFAVSYIVAQPRMSYYMKYSSQVYAIYLNYVSQEDIHVYSIDEVFIDVTDYLSIYKVTARELAMKMIHDVLRETGITATAGIGTNLYLCKVAMDIVAKHIEADENGVRIAELDEMSYRKLLWSHKPLTDFWRVGRGTAKSLEKYNIFTMGDIARCSIECESLFYNLFGVNAELLIDHAWGWEPCTMKMIKSYQPEANSLSSGQVLHCPYAFREARVVVREMADSLALDLVDKQLITNQIIVTINYDVESLSNQNVRSRYVGEITQDFYGRLTPKPAHGTTRLSSFTSSSSIIIDAVSELFDKIVDPDLLVRRITISTGKIIRETEQQQQQSQQCVLNFEDDEEREKREKKLQKERSVQETLLAIKKKFGKNSILKGLNYEEGATAKDRNNQIGGHKA